MPSASANGASTHVLGISAWFHDSAAALVGDGQVVAAAQEERFTRVKGDARFPASAIQACLTTAGVGPSDVGTVVFHETPRTKFDRLLRTWGNVGPAGWSTAREALPRWARHRLDPTAELRRALGDGWAGQVTYARHHASHAASAFFPSPFASAAIVVMDAVGEHATSSIGVGRDDRVEMVLEQRFPHSVGMLYSAFTRYCGFQVNRGEYKLMGLAPFGEPRFVDRILEEVVAVAADGSVRLDLDHLSFHRGRHMTAPSFHALFGGPPREFDGPLTQRHMDLAASIQQVCERIVLRTVHHAAQVTGERQLVMAGGVALNCVANGRVLREGPVDDVWIQPAAGDAGGALGAALLEWHHGRRAPRVVDHPDGQRASLLGPAFADDDIALFLEGIGARATRLPEPALLDRVCDWLADGDVVGWFQGPMEFGPRALGSRSILADARATDAQRRVNEKIKFRESFRPFAPSVLRAHAHEVFDVDEGIDSPYMLVTVPVRDERRRKLTVQEKDHMADPDPRVRVAVPRSDVPAVTHMDHSSRLQTVDPDRHGRYHRLLERFHDRTGCPLLLNTSFNVRGEPIVHNPADAYRCFMATDMDALVLGSYVLRRTDQPPVDPTVSTPGGRR